MTCDAVFWSPIPNATDWYVPMSKKEGCYDKIKVGVDNKCDDEKNQ